MTYLITINKDGRCQQYTAIGDRDRLMDAAYDNGAMGVFIRRIK